MAKTKHPTKPTLKKHRTLNPNALKQEKTTINYSPKLSKTHKNTPQNIEKTRKNTKKPVKEPNKHNPGGEKPEKAPEKSPKSDKIQSWAQKPAKEPNKHNPGGENPKKAPEKSPQSEKIQSWAQKPAKEPNTHNPGGENPKKAHEKSPKWEKIQSWASIRSIISCRHLEKIEEKKSKKSSSKKMRCPGSLCNNTKVMQRPEAATSLSSSISVFSTSARSMKSPINNGGLASSSSSFMVMPFRRFSGCYECRMVVDPVLGFTRDPSLRATICTCSQCGEIFMKAENLELHQAVKHAVSELGPEDTSKNIVEIIFQSSWLKKQAPVCKIERILKVQNTPRTISKFEAYRDSVKARSSSSTSPSHHQQRCLADGNELLRFHATSLVCSLGLNGSSNLCSSTGSCHVCGIIKHGFKVSGIARKGILTTATSGRAHDSAEVADGEREMRAMLVCRVIAGRVKKGCERGGGDDVTVGEEYDSVAGDMGVYSNLDELYVFSPRAILPCFVVVYSGF